MQQVCHRVAILNGGRLIFQGRWEDLAGDASRYRLELDDWAKAASALAAHQAVVAEDHTLALPPGADIADLVAALVTAGVRVRAVEPLRQSLEQIYLDTIGKR